MRFFARVRFDINGEVIAGEHVATIQPVVSPLKKRKKHCGAKNILQWFADTS